MLKAQFVVREGAKVIARKSQDAFRRGQKIESQ